MKKKKCQVKISIKTLIVSPSKRESKIHQEPVKEFIKLETIVDKEKLVNENRRFSKFSSMIVGDKLSVDEKKKMGIFVYDPTELNQEAIKRAEIMKKLQKYGVQTNDETPTPESPQRGEKKMNLAKFMFRSIVYNIIHRKKG